MRQWNREKIEEQLKLHKKQNKDDRYNYICEEFNSIWYCWELEKYILQKQKELEDYITELQDDNINLVKNNINSNSEYFRKIDNFGKENKILKEENKRLNNIINTFEEDLEREVNISEQDSIVGNYRYTIIHSTLEKMLKYLKELKESDNNE